MYSKLEIATLYLHWNRYACTNIPDQIEAREDFLTAFQRVYRTRSREQSILCLTRFWHDLKAKNDRLEMVVACAVLANVLYEEMNG